MRTKDYEAQNNQWLKNNKADCDWTIQEWNLIVSQLYGLKRFHLALFGEFNFYTADLLLN